MKGVTSSDIREVIGIVNAHVLATGTQIELLKDARVAQERVLNKLDADILNLEKRTEGIKAVNSYLEAEARKAETKEQRKRYAASRKNIWVDPEDDCDAYD